MAREFRLPDIGEGLTEAEIVTWLVAEGEHIESDQPIVEVETDKAVVEIPSPYAGVVLSHGGAEGETLAVGAVLVVIGEAGESAVAESSSTGAVAEPNSVGHVVDSAPIVGTLSEEAETIQPPVETNVEQTRTAEALPVDKVKALPVDKVKALPLVRKMARDAGLDIETITGTGPGRRVTREDVEAATQPAPSPTSPPTSSETVATETVDEESIPAGGDNRTQMSRLRRTIAANMSKSWAEIPHVTTFDDVDATRLLEVRTALSDRHQIKIPVEALVIQAVLPALSAFPEFNSTLDGDELVVHRSHDIGIAVDTTDGLIVAVIKDADARSVLELAEEVRRLGEGARERTLTLDELTGQTFTVSNIGAVGGGHGTPIIPYGTTAILSVGRARTKPIVYDGDLAIAPVMPLSISYDHRVIDGGTGRRFMALVMENLEEPALFLAG